MKDMVENCLQDKQTTRNMLKVKTKTKIARDFVNNFLKNDLKSITFLHPMGVCVWTFHRTDFKIPYFVKKN